VEQWYGVDIAGIVDREVPGTHRSMMREPDVEDLAFCLSALIDEALDVSGRTR
jgi:thioesterase domain-containing protein